jgi:hypothetical protein
MTRAAFDPSLTSVADEKARTSVQEARSALMLQPLMPVSCGPYKIKASVSGDHGFSGRTSGYKRRCVLVVH